MLVMLDTTSTMESVLLPASAAQLDNSDTTEFVTKLVPQEPALKAASVRELAQPAPGHITEDATEHAQPLSLLLMPVSTLVPLVLPWSTEFVRLALKLALPDNSGTELHHHARDVNTLALNAL